MLLWFSCPLMSDSSVTPWIGILQARILDWVAISFSKGSSWPRGRTCISCIGRRSYTAEPQEKILASHISNNHLCLEYIKNDYNSEGKKKNLKVGKRSENRVFQRWYKNAQGASLVIQWLRICLGMQGTRVQSLVQEDRTCCGATKPVCHNYWALGLEPTREATAMRSPCTTTKIK